MTDDAYQQRASGFAAMLMKQATWPAAVVLLCEGFAPLVASALGAFQAPLAVLALLASAAGGVAALALSALLVFDALLFRLMATYENETRGGAAVDDMLARMRLKPAAPNPRPLDERMAGTRRLLNRQRAALAFFAIALLAAGFWMPR